MAKTKYPKAPLYIKNIYSWLYLNLPIYNFFDNSILLNILTMGHHYLLTEELKKEITPHSNILQIGITLGSQIEKTHQSLGALGTYTIVDILPHILETHQAKHLEQHIKYIEADASKTIKGEYDTIICHLLLHELPQRTRKKLLKNIINSLKIGGKAIFIDYHTPSSYNPLKYIIRAVNRLYQPFAETLWKASIKDLTPDAENCKWSKQTYFGGIYQKVVATKYK